VGQQIAPAAGQGVDDADATQSSETLRGAPPSAGAT